MDEEGSWPCIVYKIRVGSNSSLCTAFQKWVRKRCSDVKRSLYKANLLFDAKPVKHLL